MGQVTSANVQHLNLRDDVVAAVADGRFAIHAVDHVDRGLALLTGQESGSRDTEGAFPPESINGRVATQLTEYAEAMQKYARKLEPGAPDSGEQGETES